MSQQAPDEERRFTREELARMIDAGLFANDRRRIELIHGRLVVVPPEGPLHASKATALRARMEAAYGKKAHVRDAKPLDCGAEEQPEPDLAAVVGSPEDYEGRHPRGDETLLVVEVSRSTLARDHDKAAIYANARVPAYWLIDLPNRRIEVHSGPRGDRYTMVRLPAPDEEIEYPGSGARVRVGDLVG